MLDADALADAKRAAGPTGIDQPNVSLMLPDLVLKELGIGQRADVGGAVHGKHVLEREKKIQDGENGFLDFAGIAGATNDGEAFAEVDDDEGFRPRAVSHRGRLEAGSVQTVDHDVAVVFEREAETFNGRLHAIEGTYRSPLRWRGRARGLLRLDGGHGFGQVLIGDGPANARARHGIHLGNAVDDH